MTDSNRGRPLAGFEFVEPNEDLRYLTKNFRQKPTELGVTIYKRHLEGLTIRQLAEDYGEPKSNIARIVRNVGQWHADEDARRLRQMEARRR